MWDSYHVFDRLALGAVAGASLPAWVEASILLAGSLLVLCAAELLGCHAFCGLATAIYIVLIVSHFESSMYLLLHESDSDDSCRSYCMVYQCKASSLSACSQKRQWMDHERKDTSESEPQ